MNTQTTLENVAAYMARKRIETNTGIGADWSRTLRALRVVAHLQALPAYARYLQAHGNLTLHDIGHSRHMSPEEMVVAVREDLRREPPRGGDARYFVARPRWDYWGRIEALIAALDHFAATGQEGHSGNGSTLEGRRQAAAEIVAAFREWEVVQ